MSEVTLHVPPCQGRVRFLREFVGRGRVCLGLLNTLQRYFGP